MVGTKKLSIICKLILVLSAISIFSSPSYAEGCFQWHSSGYGSTDCPYMCVDGFASGTGSCTNACYLGWDVWITNSCLVLAAQTGNPFPGCHSYLDDSDCQFNTNYCQQGSCPNIGSWNGYTCSISADSPDCDRIGTWDASSRSCILCSNGREIELLASASSSNFYCSGGAGPGDERCETACGAYSGCDEQVPGTGTCDSNCQFAAPSTSTTRMTTTTRTTTTFTTTTMAMATCNNLCSSSAGSYTYSGSYVCQGSSPSGTCLGNVRSFWLSRSPASDCGSLTCWCNYRETCPIACSGGVCTGPATTTTSSSGSCQYQALTGIPIVVPSSPTSGSSFQIRCPTGIAGLNCISANANVFNNPCSFSSWSGSTAIFTCSGMPVGSYTPMCVMTAGALCCDSDNYLGNQYTVVTGTTTTIGGGGGTTTTISSSTCSPPRVCSGVSGGPMIICENAATVRSWVLCDSYSSTCPSYPIQSCWCPVYTPCPGGTVCSGGVCVASSTTTTRPATTTTRTTTTLIIGSTTTTRLSDDAIYITSSVLTTNMCTGSTRAASVTMENTGSSTWTAANSYRLGTINQQDNSNWGFNRVYLSSSDSIATGSSKTFSFTLTAPSTPGVYNFSFRMVHDGVRWFGENAPPVPIPITVISCATTTTGLTTTTRPATTTTRPATTTTYLTTTTRTTTTLGCMAGPGYTYSSPGIYTANAVSGVSSYARSGQYTFYETPHNYTNNLNCPSSGVYRCPAGSDIRFYLRLQTEDEYDNLTIVDSGGSQYDEISGDYGTSYYWQGPYGETTAVFDFDSDGGVVDWGVDLYRIDCIASTTTTVGGTTTTFLPGTTTTVGGATTTVGGTTTTFLPGTTTTIIQRAITIGSLSVRGSTSVLVVDGRSITYNDNGNPVNSGYAQCSFGSGGCTAPITSGAFTGCSILNPSFAVRGINNVTCIAIAVDGQSFPTRAPVNINATVTRFDLETPENDPPTTSKGGQISFNSSARNDGSINWTSNVYLRVVYTVSGGSSQNFFCEAPISANTGQIGDSYCSGSINTPGRYDFIAYVYSDNSPAISGPSSRITVEVTDMLIEVEFVGQDDGLVLNCTGNSCDANYTRGQPIDFITRAYYGNILSYVKCSGVSSSPDYCEVNYSFDSSASQRMNWIGDYWETVFPSSAFVCETYHNLKVSATRNGVTTEATKRIYISCTPRLTVSPRVQTVPTKALDTKLYNVTIWNPSTNPVSYSLLMNEPKNMIMPWLRWYNGGYLQNTTINGIGIAPVSSASFLVYITDAARTGTYTINFVSTDENSGSIYSVAAILHIYSDSLNEFKLFWLGILMAVGTAIFTVL